MAEHATLEDIRQEVYLCWINTLAQQIAIENEREKTD